jgi:ABC-type Fe3+/spermidine/putrescine transport system ATPase subunit
MRLKILSDYLELIDLSKDFDDIIVVDSVNLSLKKGEVLGILGRSVCGKTTLLKLILGLIHPSTGDIKILGRSIVDLNPEKRQFGYIPQNLSLFTHLSVVENILFGLKAQKVSKYMSEKKAKSLLQLLNLEHLSKKLPHEISGGERQRVALGRALALEPKLILMDEPLSSLDTKLSHQIRWQIKNILSTTDSTAIFVTHNPGEAFSICDRIAIMDQGRILQLGTANDLLTNPINAMVLEILGKSNVFPILEQNITSRNEKSYLTSLGSISPTQTTKNRELKACWISELDVSLIPNSEESQMKIQAELLGIIWGRTRSRLIFKLPDSSQITAQVRIDKRNLPKINESVTLYFSTRDIQWI